MRSVVGDADLSVPFQKKTAVSTSVETAVLRKDYEKDIFALFAYEFELSQNFTLRSNISLTRKGGLS